MIEISSPYLLLVAFSMFSAEKFSQRVPEHLAAGPFDGVSVAYVNAYHADDVDHNQIHRQLSDIAKQTNKDVWPIVFLNRIIGSGDLDPSSKRFLEKRRFSDINGMELKDGSYALTQYIEILSNSVRFALEKNSGIVIDIEPYNSKDAYDVRQLAKQLELSEHEVIALLSDLGRQMAKVVSHEKRLASQSNLKIMLLFSGLTTKKKMKDGVFLKRSVTYVVEGLLAQLSENDEDIEVISGGELSIGYCPKNIDTFKARESKRKKRMEAYQNKYEFLGTSAPLVLWENKSKTEGWLNQGNCKNSEISSFGELETLAGNVFSTYPIVWVYGTGNSDYKPLMFNETTKAVNETITKIKHR